MLDKLIKVEWLGYQERIDGTSFLLVNEVKSHSTVMYDPEIHVLVDKKGKGGD